MIRKKKINKNLCEKLYYPSMWAQKENIKVNFIWFPS